MSLLEGWPDFTPRSTPQADYDLITEFGSVVLNPSNAVNTTASLGTYQGILVTITTTYTTMISCTLTGSSLSGLGMTCQDYIVNGGNQTGYFLLPYPCRVGDVLSVALVANPGNAAGVVVNVYGLRFLPPLVRSDMHVYPQGKNLAVQVATVASLTLIPAPTATHRIMLQSAKVVGQTAATSVSINVSVGGTVQAICDCNGIQTDNAVIPGQGLLLDPGTGATLNWAAGTAAGVALYDVVT
jgi:hypothetical protein